MSKSDLPKASVCECTIIDFLASLRYSYVIVYTEIKAAYLAVGLVSNISGGFIYILDSLNSSSSTF